MEIGRLAGTKAAWRNDENELPVSASGSRMLSCRWLLRVECMDQSVLNCTVLTINFFLNQRLASPRVSIALV